VVDFDYNGFEVISEHDIKSQNVEAHPAFVFLGLAVLVLMADGGQSADY
jgi:hypothetical protein